MISYSRPKLSDLYTLSQSKLLENHTLSLHSGTYLHTPYMAVLSPGVRNKSFLQYIKEHPMFCFKQAFWWDNKVEGVNQFL